MRHRTKYALATVVLTGLGTWIVGCGDDNGNNPQLTEAAVVTIPANNAVGYDPESPVFMMFNDRMDTVGFHDSFYCIDSVTHRGLQDSLMGHMFGMMNSGQDSMMYYQRMHERREPGQFHWNNDGDSCAFVSDNAMMGGTRYYMHFRTTMRTHDGESMRHMGGMMTEDLMFGFRTQ